MKICPLISLCVALILIQCNSPNKKLSADENSADTPIEDLITDVPALNLDSVHTVVLENGSIKAVFDRKSGRLTSLVSKQTGWQIQKRGDLSRSFRMAVPLPGRRDHCVYGEKQSSCRFVILNRNKLEIAWENLSSECGQHLDIRFTGYVELTDDGLQFSARVENNSPYTIEAVYWPYLGDLGVPETLGVIRFADQIYPNFRCNKGYRGVDYPIQVSDTRHFHYGLLGNEQEGLYVNYNDTTDNHLVNYTFELKPGYEFTNHLYQGSVPKADSIGGRPVHIEFSCVHFAYVNPKEKTELQPIVFQPYVGDWQAGADHYKAWRKTWSRPLSVPEWARKVHSWQQIHIHSSEDYPRCTYKDLVVYAKECARHGVKAIQLTGWTFGGQDRGNPSHDTDPKLGTWEDLKNAIAECRKIGVHIILFSKFTWADESQPWFEKELIRYAVRDPYGKYFNLWAYQYQTATQLTGLNTRRLVPMCHLCPEWRDVAYDEFEKVIGLGASGMLYDECMHHGSIYYCFDPDHGHHVPANVYSGDILLESGFRNIAEERDPDFLFAGESVRDLQFRSYNISYTRIGRDHIPVHRYVAPEANIMMAVIGYNDRHPINQALLYKYIISYEPRYFKGHLDEFPATVSYGEKVDALREKYSDFLWDGEFTGTRGALIRVEDQTSVKYSVFKNHRTGKRAVVVANPSYDHPVVVEIEMEQNSGGFLIASPEEPEAKRADRKTVIPALSAVVLFEL